MLRSRAAPLLTLGLLLTCATFTTGLPKAKVSPGPLAWPSSDPVHMSIDWCRCSCDLRGAMERNILADAVLNIMQSCFLFGTVGLLAFRIPRHSVRYPLDSWAAIEFAMPFQPKANAQAYLRPFSIEGVASIEHSRAVFIAARYHRCMEVWIISTYCRQQLRLSFCTLILRL